MVVFDPGDLEQALEFRLPVGCGRFKRRAPVR
jgi:hypothetical protein